MWRTKVTISETCAAPWVLVCGGFHRRGGMDRANAELARYLADRGTPVHLVATAVDDELLSRQNVVWHPVGKPARSDLLGEMLLAHEGRRVARQVTAQRPGTRVLVNGGNCLWGDVNWVHCVHHAWVCCDDRAPRWFMVKNRLTKFLSRRSERAAIAAARVIVVNSDRTRQDVLTHLGGDPKRILRVHLGADPSWTPPTSTEREAARRWLNVPRDQPVIAFVGALSHDRNKGLDTLLSAWSRLCQSRSWDAYLVIAGGGNALNHWASYIAQMGWSKHVRMLGFTNRVFDLLAAADLLVSPVHYEAYGLNVQEAICRGVPTIVTKSAGIAERFTDDLAPMLIPNPKDATDLAARMFQWHREKESWRRRFQSASEVFRRYTWNNMAHQMVSVVESRPDRQALAA